MAHYRKLKPERQRTSPRDPRHWGALCDLCPLRGAFPVFGDGPTNPRIAVVGEAPGSNEVELGVPFIGISGQYVEDVLKGFSLTRKDVLLTNAIACFPPGGDLKAFLQRTKKEHDAIENLKPAKERKAFSSPITCCRPRLMFELGVRRCSSCSKWELALGDDTACRCESPKWVKLGEYGRPAAVVPAGNAALESLLDRSGIQEVQMYVFDTGKSSKSKVTEPAAPKEPNVTLKGFEALKLKPAKLKASKPVKARKAASQKK